MEGEETEHVLLLLKCFEKGHKIITTTTTVYRNLGLFLFFSINKE